MATDTEQLIELRNDMEAILERLENITESLVTFTTLADSIHIEALREALPDITSEFRSMLDSSENKKNDS